MSIDRELVSGGFCWDRQREQVPLEIPPKAKRYPPRAEQIERKNAAARKARREMRERWLRKGIVQPKNDAEREIAARGAA